MSEAAKNSSSGVWSRNLRTLGRCSTDSDSSGSDSPANPANRRPLPVANEAAPISEDARLMRQMDLASRHDEAVYKPNPWSIAKMNAATRPQPPQETSNIRSTPYNSKRRPQGQIIDGFKRQLAKKQTQALEKAPPKKRPGPSRHSASNPSAKGPPNLQYAATTTPRSDSVPHTTQGSSDSARISAPPPPAFPQHSFPHVAPEHPLQDSALAPYPHMPYETPSSYPAGVFQPHKVGLTGRSKVTDGCDRPDGRPSHPVRRIRHPDNDNALCVGTGRTQLSPPSRTFPYNIMSSPIYAPSYASLRHKATPHAFSSPPRAPRQVPNCFSTPRKRPFDFAMNDPQTIAVQPSSRPYPSNFTPQSALPISSSITPLIPENSAALEAPHMELSPPATPMLKNISKQPLSASNDVYDLLSSPEAAWSTLPNKKNSRRSGLSRQLGTVASTKFRLPLATSTLAHTGPDTKRRQISYLPPPPRRFALHEQPSKATETKPSTGWKVTRVTASQIRENLTREDRSNVAATGKTRPAQSNSRSVNQSHPHFAGQMRWNYPSPPHNQSSPSSDSILPPAEPVTSVLEEVVRPEFVSAHRHNRQARAHADPPNKSLPSPPRSDPPSEVSNDIGQLRLPFNTQSIEGRYPRMRKAVAERKRAAAGVWDELELPSCGTIYQSSTSSPHGSKHRTQRTQEELHIIKWAGRRTHD